MTTSKNRNITQQDSIIQKRIDMDLLNRSMPGLIVQAIILPVGVFWPYNFHVLQPEICWFFSGSMIAISLLRFGQKFISDYLYTKSSRVWKGSFSLLSLSHAGLLSLLMVLAIFDPSYTQILPPVMLAVCGIASGAVVSLSPRITLSLTYLFVLLIPGIVVGLNQEEQFASVPIMILFVIFLTSVGIRAHREYIRGFYIEAQLNLQQEELEKTNKIDALTQIYNRGHFNSAYDLQWNHGIRNKIELSLLLIDVDHFKSINDEYGHVFGDECLINIAKVIDDTAKRNTDLVARFGGEEFVVLLSDTSMAEATKIAEEVCRKIGSQSVNYNNVSLKITASIGVASMVPQLEVNPSILIEHADKALYQAKHDGRNRVCEYKEL